PLNDFEKRVDRLPKGGKEEEERRKGVRERARLVQDRADNIVGELLKRGVLVIEIDSGAKPAPQRDWKTSLLPSPFEPFRGLNNAAYVNEFLAKSENFKRLRERGSKLPAVKKVTCVCNHSHDGSQDVMTAWALGPQDKANVLYEFLSARPSFEEQVRAAVIS